MCDLQSQKYNELCGPLWNRPADLCVGGKWDLSRCIHVVRLKESEKSTPDSGICPVQLG